ncbi:MAG: nickel pincer cofactor biosynthesis protein LarC [Cytophagales bacterium]|nr:nickel pincer cofactor biosynthesis protein LarC [Cytophagales bacterium]
MSILKIEAFSGLSGDMFLGALTDLAGAYTELELLPRKLHLENVEVKITEVEKAGIACRHIKILDHNTYENLEHLPAHIHSHDHRHKHTHTHHAHAGGHTPHRHLKDIEKIIDRGDLTDNARKIAKKIFLLLGAAESKVHGVDINKIHFHEVGAIDSILDIVGSAFLLDRLSIDASVSTPICTGHGFVKADHGRMPIPAPATKELLLGIPVHAGKVKGEMTTPTGAAILKYLNPSFDVPVLIEKKVGHGPGEKDFEHPNVLRLSLCESASGIEREMYMIETNIDDMSSELLGYDFQENLLNAGAVDYYFTQITMKKGRPGILISAFAPEDKVKHVSDFLLENTSTIGLRSYPVSRQILKRTLKSIKTSLGEVKVKEVLLPSGGSRVTVEYESAKEIAARLNRPVSEIFNQLNKEI